MVIYCVLAADSRARQFTLLDRTDLSRKAQEQKYGTRVHRVNLVTPGARIQDLKESTIRQLRLLPDHAIKLVTLAVGVNDLTEKVYRTTDQFEVRPSHSTPNGIIWLLKWLKEEILAAQPTAIITIATIPPIDFVRYQAAKIQKHKLPKKEFLYPDSRLKAFEELHLDKIAIINRRIVAINNREYRPTPFLDTIVIKKKRSGTYTFIRGSLADGLHPNLCTATKWHERLHEAFAKEIRRLVNQPN